MRPVGAELASSLGRQSPLAFRHRLLGPPKKLVSFYVSFSRLDAVSGLREPGTDARFPYETRQVDVIDPVSFQPLDQESPGSSPGGATLANPKPHSVLRCGACCCSPRASGRLRIVPSSRTLPVRLTTFRRDRPCRIICGELDHARPLGTPECATRSRSLLDADHDQLRPR